MRNQTTIIVLFLVFIAGILKANIINIPADHETIQGGINAAEDGDTVLVEPGEYVENINFDGKSITLGSLYLIDEDEDHIAATIIDGNEQTTTVIIDSCGYGALVGFTIRNGLGGRYVGGINCHFSTLTILNCIITQNSGSKGGIDCEYSDITIKNCIIEDNRGTAGGGLWAMRSVLNISDCIIRSNRGTSGGGIHSVISDMTIENSFLTENEAINSGGALAFHDGDLIIINCEVTSNTSDYGAGIAFYHQGSLFMENTLIADNNGTRVGGIWLGEHVRAEINNCTISGNTADEDGTGGLLIEAQTLVTNSILWANDPGQLDQVWGGGATVSWTDIENGWDGEGNIAEDPQFVNIDEGDYHLTEESPCIDAGNPTREIDPDGTRADLGAFTFLQGMLVVQGYILDNSTRQPLQNSQIVTSYRDTTYSDATGFWRFSPAHFGLFNLTASIDGYLDSTIINIELELDDTLNVVFNLLHPEISIEYDDNNYELLIGESIESALLLDNSGDGILDWDVKVKLRGEIGSEPGFLRNSFSIDDNGEDTHFTTALFIDDVYYLLKAGNPEPSLYLTNDQGELLDIIVLPNPDNIHFRDIAFDGENIWGISGDWLYQINLEGEIIDFIESPAERMRYITYDSINDWIWVTKSGSNIFACDLDGEPQMEISNQNLRIYGLAFWEADPDGYPLYFFSDVPGSNLYAVRKCNPETEEFQFVMNIEHSGVGIPVGGFITSTYDGYSTVFMRVEQTMDEFVTDLINTYQLSDNTNWMRIEPAEGELEPNGDIDIFLSLDATDVKPNYYPTDIVFTHNAVGGESIIPLDITVMDPDAVIEEINPTPQDYSITGAYPNPFNSTVKLNFSVPEAGAVSIKLYDLTGKLIAEVANGYHQPGQHSTIWDAAGMPSGLYFARMETDGFSQAVKLMLMK